VWLRGVWQTGPAARRVLRDSVEPRREFEQTLPDLAGRGLYLDVAPWQRCAFAVEGMQ